MPPSGTSQVTGEHPTGPGVQAQGGWEMGPQAPSQATTGLQCVFQKFMEMEASGMSVSLSLIPLRLAHAVRPCFATKDFPPCGYAAVCSVGLGAGFDFRPVWIKLH